MGLHDPVTGLPTRRLFVERTRQALQLADRRESEVAVVIWRLPGPAEGGAPVAGTAHDRMMGAIARQLQAGLRGSDLVAKVDDSEFALLLTGLEDQAGLEEALGRLTRRPLPNGSQPLQGRRLEFRAGAALYPDHGVRAEDLLARAREALERAAREKAELRIYRRGAAPERDDEAAEAGVPPLPGPAELRSALEEERFTLAWQPIVGLRDRALKGREARLQLPRPGGSAVPARALRPVLREHGLREAADGLALKATLRRLAAGGNGGSPEWLSVDQAVETVAAEAFPERLGALLEGTGAPAQRLVVELPADGAREDPDAARTALAHLQGAGVRIALDGVGAGPLPLVPLGERPLHFLKLAPAAVRHLDREPSRAHLAQALIGLAHALEAQAVATGVESDKELRRLAEIGCDLAQGFHVGEPQPGGSA